VNGILIVVLVVGALALGQAAVWASEVRRAPGGDPLVPGLPAWDREPPLAPGATLAGWLEGVPGMQGLRRLQSQAGNAWPTLYLVLLILVCAVGAQVGVTFLLGSPGFGLLAGVVGSTAPVAALVWRKAERAQEITAALPRALRSLTRLCQAGHTAAAAIVETARGLEGPLGSELARVYGEQRDGRSLQDALNAMLCRVPDSIDLRILVHAILLAEESGGNLGSLLARIDGTLAARLQAWQQARAETSQARLSAGILCALPPLAAAALFVVQRAHIEGALSDPTGRVMFIAAALWMGVGMLVVIRLLRTGP
jgi:tight adherence protein B